ncbi:MAG TPA: TonB-dependent receptor plug domain-containing protein, partial [Longimicrobiales bacterium]
MVAGIRVQRTGAGALPCLLILSFAACGRGGTLPPQGPHPDSVSVAYGTEARATVTGSVSSVPAGDLKTPGFTRIEQLLEGVSGIEVTRLSGGDFTVRVRGARSLLGSDDPLLVIDGSPVP